MAEQDTLFYETLEAWPHAARWAPGPKQTFMSAAGAPILVLLMSMAGWPQPVAQPAS